ncbi:gas vesicle protein [Saccharopolyspora rhizosphaerae]|uniref:Gas vesicle protein n=1 Tax=Saccharopolyspora rhizosphaerae TaxID=2492662 RepID=A0A3R8P2R8_9PSEU|nr:gas vesicle protein [Saccharopolyspora rhizosphaerae]RRO18792.1 gas vesicle protein [Saccharopolyspora rhizosphaerae]
MLGGSPERSTTSANGANLADILERVLDKGIVIAGDIQVNLLDIELLTIKVRLLVASVDKAKEMGIDWWEHDPSLSSGRMGDNRRTGEIEGRTTRTDELEAENDELRERLAALEQAVSRPEERTERPSRDRARGDRPRERRREK